MFKKNNINKVLKIKQPTDPKEIKEKKLLKIVFIYLTIILVIRFICSFFPEERLWGLNHAAFINGMPFLYLGLFLIGIFLYISGYNHPEIIDINGSNKFCKSFNKIFPYLIILISGMFFYFFSIKAYFLGDGYLLLSILSNQDTIGKSLEIGEFRVHELYLKLFGLFTMQGARLAYKNISILSGLIFIVSLAYYGRKITRSFFSYCGLMFLTLTSAGTILFFGYVENYSITSAMLYIFFLSGISALKNNKKAIIPIISYLTALYLHKIAIVYLPAFLFCIVTMFSSKKVNKLLLSKYKHILTLLVILFISFYIVVKICAPLFWQISFLHPYNWRFTVEGYTLFSLKHIIDFFNLLVFLIPISLIALSMVLLMPFSNKKKIDKPTLFVLIGSQVGLMAVFIFEPNLGMARDWDLISVMSIGALVGGIYYWIDRFYDYKFYRLASVLMLLINLSIYLPWLTLVNSKKGIYDYSFSIMKLDTKRSRTGIFNLIEYNKRKGYYFEVNKLEEYRRKKYPEREYWKEGEKYYKAGDYKKAEDLFFRTIKEAPRNYTGYGWIGTIRYKQKRYKEALEYLKISNGLNPENYITEFMLGTAYSNLDNDKLALKYWKKSIKHNISFYDPYIALGNYFYKKGIPDSAKFYFTRFPLSKYPVGIYYRLGLVELQLGDTVKAMNYFNTYLEKGSDTTLINQIEHIKVKLK